MFSINFSRTQFYMFSQNPQIISVVVDQQFSISCFKQNEWSIVDRPALNPACSYVSSWENNYDKKVFIIFPYNLLKIFNTEIPL
jgi:hypothetical protein